MAPSTRTVRIRQGVLCAIALIIVLDLSQPLFEPWSPRHAAALAGAAVYAAAGLAIASRVRLGLWVTALMPIVPITTLSAWAVGLAVPVEPHAMMVAIASVQCAAGGLAAWLLASGPSGSTA